MGWGGQGPWYCGLGTVGDPLGRVSGTTEGPVGGRLATAEGPVGPRAWQEPRGLHRGSPRGRLAERDQLCRAGG